MYSLSKLGRYIRVKTALEAKALQYRLSFSHGLALERVYGSDQHFGGQSLLQTEAAARLSTVLPAFIHLQAPGPNCTSLWASDTR